MKVKAKSLREFEIDKYIQTHEGRLTEDVVLLTYANAPERKGYLDYYEFENGKLLLVMKQLNGRQGTLYSDKDAYVKNMVKINEWRTRTPLDKYQDTIRNLSLHLGLLINELYAKLKLKEDVPPKDVDLEKLDKAIKKYGYEKCYEDLYLHLIIFAGEYSKDKVGGKWIIETSAKNELVPVFISSKNKKLEFGFLIEKDFKKYQRINMAELIGAELHGSLPVYPNPTLSNPTKQ